MARANRRDNELFIGKEHMNKEGRDIKHPGMIDFYANLNHNKTQDEPIDLIGLDLETDHKTGELKLLGFFFPEDRETYKGKYAYYTSDFLEVLASMVKTAINQKMALAYWNKLDSFQLLKLFILHGYSEDRERDILERFGKVGGEYNKKAGSWEVQPVAKVTYGNSEFGIKQAIRSSIQFYHRNTITGKLETAWAFDIAGLYFNGLEEEAGRFDWYSKIGQEYHLVDWQRFESDQDYRKNVLLSNELDARAAMALGYEIQKKFYRAFGAYPRSLISQGSLARSALTAMIERDLIKEGYEGEELNKKKYEEVKSISFMNYYDEWLEKLGQKDFKDFYCLITEAYSGGYIEAVRYGYSPKGWYADIASAYPGVITTLEDLRGAEIIKGEGPPPKPETGYIFIRGDVEIPEGVDYHSITIKHPMAKETNIRPVGEFKASYLWEEREFAREQGAKFNNETWYWIKTTGKKSPIAKTCSKFVDLRERLIAQGDSAEYMAKISANSLYGILFEAVDIFQEDEEGRPERTGYRGGEFWNPIYASIITARTRLILAKACLEIERNGGKPIILMTDSITWEGKKEDLPRDLELPFGYSGVREKKKTLGYFEGPKEVKEIICLGPGRYGFIKDGKQTDKVRGLNIVNFGDPYDTVIDQEFSWYNVLMEAREKGSLEIPMTVRTLISPGMVQNRKKYTAYDLGRIVEDDRTVNIIVGTNKRFFPADQKNPYSLAKGLVKTSSIKLSPYMFGKYEPIDGTLPFYRDKVMERKAVSQKNNKRNNSKGTSRRYREKKKVERKENYRLLREAGFSRDEAMKIQHWSRKKVEEEIKRKGK